MKRAVTLTKFRKIESPGVAKMTDVDNVNAAKFREPYKATKLWLEAVAIFRRGVPLGKHRKQWKTYEECFVAQDAINWFQSQLQVAFDPSISRKQTLMLLQKFYKANIIAEVSRGAGRKQSPFILDETEFKDNGQLYRLCGPASPKNILGIANYDTKSLRRTVSAKSAQTVQEPVNEQVEELMPEEPTKYEVIIRSLTQDEIDGIWEKCFMNKFVQIVGCDVFNSFYKQGIIKGNYLSYNLTKVGPRSIVLSVNKSHDLPHWLISAMKCLANWPSDHTQETGVPNYPGFENDVFKLISDYFVKSQAGNPLLTHELYDAFITTFIRAELFDFNSRLYSAKLNNASRTKIFQYHSTVAPNTPIQHGPFSYVRSPMFRMEDQYPFNASESVENLILDILTPSVTKGFPRRQRNHQRYTETDPRKKLFHVPQQDDGISVTGTSETSALLEPPPAMDQQSYNLNRYSVPLFYETAFTQGSPITRVVSQTELKASLGEKSRSRTHVRPPASSASAILERDSYAYENPVLDLSASDMINHPKYENVRSEIDNEVCETRMSPAMSLMNYTTFPAAEDSGHESGNSSGTNSFLDDRSLPPKAVSAVNLTEMNKMRARQYISATLPKPLRNRAYEKEMNKRHSVMSVPGQRMSLASQYANSPSKSVRRMLEYYYGADACVPGLMTQEGKNLAVISFRLLTLLLPPENRRKLQILLRFMSKTSRNEKLMLDVATTTRAIVINTFFRQIMASQDPEEFDELLALRIVTFLMDNDQEIFAVDQEQNIITEAQEEVSRQQIVKVPSKVNIQQPKSPAPPIYEDPLPDATLFFEANKENTAQFCSRISMDEYDDQRLLSSTSKSLRDLLDYYLKDDTMDPKIRRRQILKFREEYPLIYYERFGDDDPTFLNESQSKDKKEKRGWKMFKAFRL